VSFLKPTLQELRRGPGSGLEMSAAFLGVLADLRANGLGTNRGFPPVMAGVRYVEDLIAWRLSADLRDRLLELVKTGPITSDPDFRDQIRDAARSAPRNIAEGFGHFNPREFARYTRIALASLFEVKNHLQDAQTQQYFSEQDTKEVLRLASRAIGATTRLLKYLRSCKGRPPTGWDFEGTDSNP
jgi:four helix bundle protein